MKFIEINLFTVKFVKEWKKLNKYQPVSMVCYEIV